MDDYQQTIRTLSDRIVLAQTPIRVLDAVKRAQELSANATGLEKMYIAAIAARTRPWCVRSHHPGA